MTMLEVLLSLGRLLLVAVFVVAAVTKLLDRGGTRHALAEFGAPQALAGALAILLPLAELAVAALLIPTATAVAGAAGAVALLALFSAAIAISLARGRAPDCHCFGQLHSEPAGPRTLARNAALAAVALFTLAGSLAEPRTGILDWADGLSGAEVLAVGLGLALAVLVAVGVTAFLTLLRSYGRVLIRVERLEGVLAEAGYELDALEDEPQLGLAPGTPAPGFELVGTAGEVVALDDLLARRLPVLLLFTSPGCAPCEALLPDVANWQEAHADRLTVAVLEEGETAEIRATAERSGLQDVLADPEGRVYHAYDANGTPSAVLVAGDGTVASHLAAGPGRVAELVAGVLDAPGLPPGAPAPALDGLALLSGAATSLSGRESLVVFWNPDCGFCRSMHGDLLEWEAAANGSSPQLVLISSGDEERTRAEGFASPVLSDPEFSVGGTFGAAGTPSAVLVDAEGRVASEVMVGAEAILGRVRGPRLMHVG
jgi:thiol-disulfide isomerase/thioredoxin